VECVQETVAVLREFCGTVTRWQRGTLGPASRSAIANST